MLDDDFVGAKPYTMAELNGLAYQDARVRATVIALEDLRGPKCELEDCPDYDGEHPYHRHIGVRYAEVAQEKLLKTIEELEAIRKQNLHYIKTLERTNHHQVVALARVKFALVVLTKALKNE